MAILQSLFLILFIQPVGRLLKDNATSRTIDHEQKIEEKFTFWQI
ncbi:MAG: hypothetical protein OXE78_14915 [Gammaproteobacteria bacterium]|nr:hypothetical protein [Gammaproteobacteria bacterium]MCY4358441.1 hypothetical protein [Gammaproteobacteria bacterium]